MSWLIIWTQMAQNMLLGPKTQGEDFLKFLLKGFKLLFWIKCRIFQGQGSRLKTYA